MNVVILYNCIFWKVLAKHGRISVTINTMWSQCLEAIVKVQHQPELYNWFYNLLNSFWKNVSREEVVLKYTVTESVTHLIIKIIHCVLFIVSSPVWTLLNELTQVYKNRKILLKYHNTVTLFSPCWSCLHDTKNRIKKKKTQKSVNNRIFNI